MALAETITGDGKVVGGSSTQTIVSVGGMTGNVLQTRAETTEEREWYAVTLAACVAKAADPDEPPDADSTYSYRWRPQDPHTGAYVMTRTLASVTFTPIVEE